MKHLVICIIGASGSGKTTASMILQEQFGFEAIVSYTTRPKRKGEKDGVDHWFVSKNQVPPQSKMCAYTEFGGYEYWTTWDQFLTITPSVYVIDEKGLMNLLNKKEKPFDLDIYTIKLNRDDLKQIDKSRKDRDKERITLPDSMYDYIINNNKSIDSLRMSLHLTAKGILLKHENNGGKRR